MKKEQDEGQQKLIAGRRADAVEAREELLNSEAEIVAKGLREGVTATPAEGYAPGMDAAHEAWGAEVMARAEAINKTKSYKNPKGPGVIIDGLEIHGEHP